MQKRVASTPEPPPEPSPDPILSQHHTNLQTLITELDGLQRLSDRWRDLAAELETAETQIGDTVTELLSGESGDEEFSQGSVRIASLQAQISALRKRANLSGTALQQKMQKDYLPPCEWLAGLWLEHRLRVETSKILELVSEARRGTVTEAARTLALVSLCYCASVDELPPCAPYNYGWQRPILPLNEKSWISQSAIADPMFKVPDPRETVGNLIEAARAQVKRWERLLAAIGKDSVFVAPTSYQQPEPVVWQPTKLENPQQPRLKPTWEASDFVEKAG